MEEEAKVARGMMQTKKTGHFHSCLCLQPWLDHDSIDIGQVNRSMWCRLNNEVCGHSVVFVSKFSSWCSSLCVRREKRGYVVRHARVSVYHTCHSPLCNSTIESLALAGDLFIHRANSIMIVLLVLLLAVLSIGVFDVLLSLAKNIYNLHIQTAYLSGYIA